MRSEAKPALPAIDDYIEIFGRQWDCQNVISVHRYIDDIKTEDNKFTTRMFYLRCSHTDESLNLEESHLIQVLAVAGGEVTVDPLKAVI